MCSRRAADNGRLTLAKKTEEESSDGMVCLRNEFKVIHVNAHIWHRGVLSRTRVCANNYFNNSHRSPNFNASWKQNLMKSISFSHSMAIGANEESIIFLWTESARGRFERVHIYVPAGARRSLVDEHALDHWWHSIDIASVLILAPRQRHKTNEAFEWMRCQFSRATTALRIRQIPWRCR